MFLLAWSRGRWWTVAPSTLWLERWFSILCYACGAVAYSCIRRVVGNAPFCSAFGTVAKASVRETINTISWVVGLLLRSRWTQRGLTSPSG